MKTYQIKDLLKKDLLIVEMPNVETEMSIGLHCIGIKPPPIGKDASDTNGYYHVYTEMFHGFKLLGKPDEIKEEDAEELVEPFDLSYYVDYNHPSRGAYTITATESLLSAIESVIFWENPYAEPDKFIDGFDNPCYEWWQDAELRTFDRSQSIIFIKN